MTGYCECGNEPLGSIKCDENIIASKEGICPMDLNAEHNLLIMNWGALVKRKAVYDEGFRNVYNNRWRKSNFVKSH